MEKINFSHHCVKRLALAQFMALDKGGLIICCDLVH